MLPPLQMLLGLQHMHQRKVLHRDFKTLNVFLDGDLNVRLGDLGVAKVRKPAGAWPGSRTVMETLPVEQWQA